MDQSARRGYSVRISETTLVDIEHARETLDQLEKELYDRVGTAVDDGLAEVVRAVRDGTAAALRAGRALQQRVEQQAAQSETLRRRVEQLSGQVTCLDADYRALAATLREWWN